MYKLILFICLSFIIIDKTQAQDIIKIDNITVVNDAANNVIIQLDVDNQAQNLLSRINETNVSQKMGFNAQLDADNTLLTLNFTQKFTERELEILLEYCGFKLDVANFNQLKNLLN